jgi:hypothetical protein
LVSGRGCPSLSSASISQVLPAKHRFIKVGDAGFEPATSSL